MSVIAQKKIQCVWEFVPWFFFSHPEVRSTNLTFLTYSDQKCRTHSLMSIHLVHQESKNFYWSIVYQTSSQSLKQSTYQPLSFQIVLKTPTTSPPKIAFNICSYIHLVWIGTVPRSRSCRAEWHASPPTSLLPSWFPTSCSLLSSTSTSTSCSTSPSDRSRSRRSYCGTSTKWNLTPSHRYIQKDNLLI